MVELQTARPLWLQYRTGGLTWADAIRQRIHGEHLSVPNCSENADFISSTELLNRHLRSRVCERRRSLRNQNAERRRN